MTRRRAARAALALAVAMPLAAQAPRSGFEEMGPAIQAMQQDDMANPGMLSVQEGEALWAQPAGPAGRSCAGCHGEAAASMRGVAARHPAFDAASGAPIDLAGRIQRCRTEQQGAPPLARESPDLLALSAFVAHQSRGMPVSPDPDPGLAPFRARGEAEFRARRGQLDLSCAQCHEDRAGGRLGGSLIPQGHPNGYPLYRLEWQRIGSLQRRLRNCMVGVRAEPFAFGAPEYVEIELFLMSRAAGLAIETPAVRP
ncbi:sulfur oxidation c-type cytochrome SoxA [Muricoccus vinaceus]|uniref:SoxAX cytochrome complex subunit A n=1 Tax=Muricoccus vinaceus TaxID=424704 RepID=A0ABV6IZ90_9PROT